VEIYQPNSFLEHYPKLSESVVAIVSNISRNSDFPEIIGTGFVVREDGIIMTCQHVIEAFKEIPRRKGASDDEWPASVLMFKKIDGKGVAVVPMAVKGAFLIKNFKPGANYYGQKIPDVGFLRVNYKGLTPHKILFGKEFKEGEILHYSGFDLGTTALRNIEGHIHQLRPILKQGMVSAVLPFPCSDPHLILLDSLSLGGVSGGPVFADNGMVVGMITSGFDDTKLTYAIPANFLSEALANVKDASGFQDHRIEQIELEDWVKKQLEEGKVVTIKPKDPQITMKPLSPDQIEIPK